MERRTVIKLSIAGAAGVAVLGVGGLGLRRTLLLEPLRDLTFFSPREFSIFAAATQALLPREVAIDDAPRVIAHGADEFLGSCEPVSVADMKKLLLLFDNALAGLLIARTTAPFTRLDLEHRRRVLDAWRFHKRLVFRSGYNAIKRLALSLYYAMPETWESTGYPGPPDMSAFAGAPEPIFLAQEES